MSNKNFLTNGKISFEDLKQINGFGAEYWSARDLQLLFGYDQWRRFEQAIKRGVSSCKQSENNPKDHFAGAGKMVDLGSSSIREVPDYHLSRFACYLIAQNGDPRKPEIANAQKYFAIQTRRQELSDQLSNDLERLQMRQEITEDFKALSSTAKNAGVQNKMFGVFHDAGYKGLYGGLTSSAIKKRKKIPEQEQLMDRMDRLELAANKFRMTQTQDKLISKNINNQALAIKTHQNVGKEVRAAIKRIGGTLPEEIPPAEHIKQVKNRVKKTLPKKKVKELEKK